MCNSCIYLYRIHFKENTQVAKFITKHRRGTTDEWANSQVIPAAGEIVLEECSDGQVRLKVGDGSSLFSDLDYITDALDSEIASLNARLTSHTQFNSGDDMFGENTVESELVDARVTADGVTHRTLGGAVRSVGQEVISLKNNLSDFINAKAVDGLTYEDNYLYLTAGGEVLEQSRVQILGGTGGGATGQGGGLKISYITPSPAIVAKEDAVVLKYTFSGTDSAGDDITAGIAKWYVGNSLTPVATETISSGENEFSIGDSIPMGKHNVRLVVTDLSGTYETSKPWSVQRIDFRLASDTDTSTMIEHAPNSVVFTCYPYGDAKKTVYCLLDNDPIPIDSKETELSGAPLYFTINGLTHGSHIVKVYMKALIGGGWITSNELVEDIIYYDSSVGTPIISASHHDFTTKQYTTTTIKYTVYQEGVDSHDIKIYVDGKEVASPTVTLNGEFLYNADEVGSHQIEIKCGDTVKTIKVKVDKLDINASPITEGLVFDFNPVGRVNEDITNRLWEGDNGVKLEVSDNFDWINGGYKSDADGPCFIVKAGSTATITHNLFGSNDTKDKGKEFKVIFKTRNIKKRDTSFLSCLDNGIGLNMRVEDATISYGDKSLTSNYCEDTAIEYEFNINKQQDMMIVMSYEDGTPSKPAVYTSASNFQQDPPKPITIGSNDCDVYIYRMRAYSRSLSDTDIKQNFIADARSTSEMLDRHDRNNIYIEGNKLVTTASDGSFSANALMEAAPDLRYIFLEVPQFTNDKDNKIDGCTVYFRYPAGTRPQDNWTCTGMRHRGQGTSSNSYGYAGRNIDLCMDRSTSLFTWVDEEGNTVESSTITLTDTSVPTDYLNIKVNIASSENANNAQLARRFNEYQPFLRYARKKDSKVKDTMEFYNCVVFIRETSTNFSDVPHREFNDTDWHFYAIGNVGDSKKTDDTRVNNANDPKEHIIEISDADKPLSAFPSLSKQFAEGKTAYDILHSTEYVYDEEGKFESFGGETYEFRYEMDGITEAQREDNINTWRDLYEFIVTSTDEEFYANLKNYFVVDSALYYYLFTERYTMVDNRAKNSFWHYGKVYISETKAAELGEIEASYYIIDNDAAAIADGYRYDLTMGYDMDTALGIDNTGDYVFAYGKEDTDHYDGLTSKEVFRVSDSTFFCRLRDLFPSEMQAMFKDREEKNAWNSTSLIDQWDNSQAQFPEELWRLDYERKYYRTYLGLSIDNSIAQGKDETFLIGKFFGRKKYARRAFETNQEIYFATKYFGNKALSDVFWIRGNEPEEENINDNLKQNYSLVLTPYSDMYLIMKYTSTGTPIHSVENGKPKRIRAGESYTFENTAEKMDFIYVYAASWIQEVGDLSRCYIEDNNFAAATRLQTLIIGSTDEDYMNPHLKTLGANNSPLLEYLDIRNTGLEGTLTLNECGNLKTIYATGTNLTSVLFARKGLLETAHLPNTITNLTLKDMSYLTNLKLGDDNQGYESVTTLVVENCGKINATDIINKSPKLNRVRLIGIDWELNDASMFTRGASTTQPVGLLNMKGESEQGNAINIPIIEGKVHFNDLSGEDYERITTTFPNLKVTFSRLQSKVYFKDESDNLLHTEVVYNPKIAGQPVEELGVTLFNVPNISANKNETDEYRFKHDGWTRTKGSEDEDGGVFTNILSDRTVYPRFVREKRTYIVRFYTGNSLIYSEELPYGTQITYDTEKALNASDDLVWKDPSKDSYTTPKKQNTGAPEIFIFNGWLPDVSVVTSNVELHADFITAVDGVTVAPITDFVAIQEDTNYTLSITQYIAQPNDAGDNSSAVVISVADKYTPNGEGTTEYTVVSIDGFSASETEVDVEYVDLPDTVTRIEDGAFYECSKLINADIGENVTYLGANCYHGCISLETVEFNAEDIKYAPGMTNGCFSGAGSKNGFELVVGEKVKHIPSYLFYNNSGANTKLVSSITWKLAEGKSNCEVIATGAFQSSVPETLVLPDGIVNLGSKAFANDNYHTEISYAMSPDNHVVTLPSTIKTLGSGVFDSWTNLTKIALPNTIESIGGAIAPYCDSLTEIEVEPGGRYASVGNCLIDTSNSEYYKLLQGCNSSVIPTSGNTIKAIENYAFAGSKITEITLPESLESIGQYAFRYCRDLETIEIPANVTSLQSQTFEECGIRSITLTNGKLNKIGTYCFWKCKNLSEITIPESVSEISTKAFNECTGLTKVTLGNNLTSMAKDIFAGCVALSQIHCEFSSSSELAESAPWGAPSSVTVYYSDGEPKTFNGGSN